MNATIKRLLSSALAILLLAGPWALAENNQGSQVLLTLEALSVPDIAPTSLKALNRFLAGTALKIGLWEGDSLIALTQNGQDSLSLLSQRTGEGRLESLEIKDYYPKSCFLYGEEALPFEGLWGDASIGSGLLFALPEAEAGLKTLREKLKPGEGEPVKKLLALSDAGKAKTQLVSSWQAPEARALLQECFPTLSLLLLQNEAFANGLEARRLFDKDENEIGLVLEGKGKNAFYALYAQSDKGLYFRVRLPALSEFSMSLHYKRTGTKTQRFVGEAIASVKGAGKTPTRYGLNFDLSLSAGKDKQSLSGSVKLSYRPDAERKDQWLLKPKLSFVEGLPNGEISIKGTSNLRADLLLNLKLASSSGLNKPSPDSKAAVDLSQAEPKAREEALKPFGLALVTALKDGILALPQEERLSLIHDLGRGIWPMQEAPGGLEPVTELRPGELELAIKGLGTLPVQDDTEGENP